MENQNEELLQAWLRLSMTIDNAKFVSELPYNESLICSILYRQQEQNSGEGVTATELCKVMRMQKSQMNRTLGNMEKKGMIRRIRSEKDRRKMYLILEPEQMETYERQHREILDFVDRMVKRVGEEKAGEILELLTVISNTAEEVMK